MPETNKQIHTHLRSISRVNTLLAIVALVAVGLLYVWFKFSLLPASIATDEALQQQDSLAEQHEDTMERDRMAVDPIDQEALGEEYRTEVNDLLSEYAFDDSGVASDHLSAVLDMLVPSAMQTVHLEVVIALTEAQKGDYESAQNRVRELSGNYAWLETAVE